MNKTRNNELIRLADEKLKASNMLNGDTIAETYDGKTAALSVSVAMSDLLPTLAIYYQDYDEKNPTAPCRRNVLNVIATMITNPDSNQTFSDAQALLKYAIDYHDKLKDLKSDVDLADSAFDSIDYQDKLKDLKRDVIDCAIALKQVVRTYNLVKS